MVKVGACDSLGLEDVSSLTPILGEAGEVAATIYGGRMNRKQMMWLLPSLLSLRSRKARGTFRRASAGGLGLEGELQATGSYGGATPMQMLMGEVAMGSDSPRVLGAGSQHIRVPGMDDYTPIEKLRLERETLGFAVSRNLMELYADAPGAKLRWRG